MSDQSPNKTDAGNGSKAICRVIDASRSPSPDPGRSLRKMESSEEPHPFVLQHEAWQAARSLVNERGDIKDDLASVRRKFFRRKNPKKFPEAEAAQALEIAVRVLQESEKYRRMNVGMTAPKTEKRYEVLHGLAKHLAAEFSGAPDAFFLMACREIERSWDW